MSLRYMLFAGEWHYPGMGMKDYAGQWDTVAEAEKEARRRLADPRWAEWAHILDTEEMVIVKSFEEDSNEASENTFHANSIIQEVHEKQALREKS